MASPKLYFSSRVDRTVNWSFEGGSGRYGEPHRREYAVTARAVDQEQIAAHIQVHDFDRAGQKLTRLPRDLGIAKVSFRGLPTPVDVLEELCRAADPAYFESHPRAPRTGQNTSSDSVEHRLKALDAPENRGKDEITPAPASAARFRKFWSENPGLFLPELFSSRDGTIRARWQDGHDRTLWVNFPEKGPLGWSVSVPRQASSGLRRVNAKCPDDQDVIPFAASLGVRCRP